jgi:hypothetical protein
LLKEKVKNVKTSQDFNPVYYGILTFYAPGFEVFLHFTINHKIDIQTVSLRKMAGAEFLLKFLPFCFQKVGYKQPVTPPGQ